MSSANRIASAFDGKKGFVAFITGGDPDIDTTVELIFGLAEAGADLIEIGIPFSDPIAEGEVKTGMVDSIPQTIIVVIGESLTRNHMSLYGYPRNTNPLLSERKDNLYVYNNRWLHHIFRAASGVRKTNL